MPVEEEESEGSLVCVEVPEAVGERDFTVRVGDPEAVEVAVKDFAEREGVPVLLSVGALVEVGVEAEVTVGALVIVALPVALDELDSRVTVDVGVEVALVGRESLLIALFPMSATYMLWSTGLTAMLNGALKEADVPMPFAAPVAATPATVLTTPPGVTQRMRLL